MQTSRWFLSRLNFVHLVFLLFVALPASGAGVVTSSSPLLLSGETKSAIPSAVNETQKFALDITNDLISLTANQAPLKELMEYLGARVGAATEIHISVDEKVTVAFRDLPLAEAIKRLSANYAYISNEKDGKISKITLYSKGQEAARTSPSPLSEIEKSTASRVAPRFETAMTKDTAMLNANGAEQETTAAKQAASDSGGGASFEFMFDPSQFMDEGGR